MSTRQKWECVKCGYVFDGPLASECNWLANGCPKCYSQHLRSPPKQTQNIEGYYVGVRENDPQKEG